MKRIFRVASLISLFLVLSVAIVRIADEVRFRMARPASAGSCNYFGRWESRDAPFVSGRILAEIPTPAPKGEPFTVNAFVYYSVFSPYRLGTFMSVEFDGFIEEAGMASGGGAAETAPAHHRMMFSSKHGSHGSQVLSYLASADLHFSEIAGAYRSSKPSDCGTFWLEELN